MTTAIEMQEAADQIDALADMIDDVRRQATKVIATGVLSHGQILRAIPSEGLLSSSVRDLRKLAAKLRPPEADKPTPLETDR